MRYLTALYILTASTNVFADSTIPLAYPATTGAINPKASILSINNSTTFLLLNCPTPSNSPLPRRQESRTLTPSIQITSTTSSLATSLSKFTTTIPSTPRPSITPPPALCKWPSLTATIYNSTYIANPAPYTANSTLTYAIFEYTIPKPEGLDTPFWVRCQQDRNNSLGDVFCRQKGPAAIFDEGVKETMEVGKGGGFSLTDFVVAVATVTAGEGGTGSSVSSGVAAPTVSGGSGESAASGRRGASVEGLSLGMFFGVVGLWLI